MTDQIDGPLALPGGANRPERGGRTSRAKGRSLNLSVNRCETRFTNTNVLSGKPAKNIPTAEAIGTTLTA
ncbi:hypothetical protein [Levilactobacillus fuyuanensis]|uniref:Uncharacterized protein n=1 Tax=Levilactobacillus fuyuanensis TaxID=2486022 RepID=A0ABW4H2Q8_9LACO|nr:hypothetical protein [Levilactobacillus fuyuanensis]